MSTPLITRQGYDKLRKEELDDLWRIERPEVTKLVTWAVSLGEKLRTSSVYRRGAGLYRYDSHDV